MPYILLLLVLIIAGCKKYDEGPAFTLKSKKERLANKWRIERYYMNGEDKTAQLDSMYMSFEFTRDGKYQEIMAHHTMSYVDDGKWEFIFKQEAVEIYRSNDTIIWHITKLKEDELWTVYTPSSSFRFEYHLKPFE